MDVFVLLFNLLNLHTNTDNIRGSVIGGNIPSLISWLLRYIQYEILILMPVSTRCCVPQMDVLSVPAQL